MSQLGGKIRCQFSKDPLSKRVLITTPKESWSTAHIFFVPPTVACVHQQLRNWRHGWGLQVAGNPLAAVLSLAKWGWKSVCPHDEPRHARAQHTGYVDMQWRSSITRFRHFAVKLYIFALFQLLLSGNSLLFKSAHFGPFDPVRPKWCWLGYCSSVEALIDYCMFTYCHKWRWTKLLSWFGSRQKSASFVEVCLCKYAPSPSVMLSNAHGPHQTDPNRFSHSGKETR